MRAFLSSGQAKPLPRSGISRETLPLSRAFCLSSRTNSRAPREIHVFSDGLKSGEAEVVYLRLFAGMTYEQIAREVNKSTASVYRICQQVIAHLRQRFRESSD